MATDEKKQTKLLVLSSNINKESAKTIIEEILRINSEDDEKDRTKKDYKREPIHMVINSYGGVVYDGFGIISVMENSKTPVHTYVPGYAMSMGLLLAASGHKRSASKLATFMYHQISTGGWGKIEEIRQDLEESLRLEAIYDTHLLSKTSIRKIEIEEVKRMKKDWFISADEALKLNIIDEII